MLVKIGNVFQFPPNIFWSEGRANVGNLVAGYNAAAGGTLDRANRWFLIGFKPGAGWNDLMDSTRWYIKDMGSDEPTNGGTLAGWLPVTARDTPSTRKYGLSALVGAELDGNGDVYIDETKAKAATLNGKYGSYVPATTTTTAGGIDVGTQPPGLESMGDVTTPNIQAIEFSVIGDGFWVARTPEASAANNPDNPHRGVSIINDGAWEKYSAGASVRDAFSLDEYKKAGWTGLDKPFLAYQGGKIVQPAGEELATAMDAVMERNDKGALRALRAVGVKPPEAGKYEQAGGFLDRLGALFG